MQHDEKAVDEKGWLPSGDVGTIDSEGYLRITDRIKDVIKSGGEWISSIAIEDIALSHPQVIMTTLTFQRHAECADL